MEKHGSSHAHQDIVTPSDNKKSPFNLSEKLEELMHYAHHKFSPEISRAQKNDDAQETFTSAATNLAKGGLLLSKLAVRVAENLRSSTLEKAI